MRAKFLLILIPLFIIAFALYKNKSATPQNEEPLIEAQVDKEINVETNEDEYHAHAAFLVYKEDFKVDFSGFEYMHIEPCNIESHEPSDIPEENVHLHDLVGDVVHVHQEGITWGVFFKSLKYEFEVEPVGYVNGELVANILETQIMPYDRVLFVEGKINEVESKLADIPSIDYIKEIEGKSESCGS